MSLGILALKIIGCVLLGAVALLLLSLCLVLFVPVRYSAFGNIDAPKWDYEMRASWLLRLLRLRLDGGGLGLWVLWFAIPLGSDEEDADEADSPAAGEAFEYEDGEPTENPPGIFKRIKEILKKIEYYKNHPDRREIVSATKDLAVELFQAALPKTFRLEGEIGLKHPHLTGYLFSVIWVIGQPLRPNFNESRIRLTAELRGDLNLWSILWPLFKYAIKRPIWPIVKRIIKKGDVK